MPCWFDLRGWCGENEKSASPEWACGAAGSALPWHGRGHRFDPDQVHQTTPTNQAHAGSEALPPSEDFVSSCVRGEGERFAALCRPLSSVTVGADFFRFGRFAAETFRSSRLMESIVTARLPESPACRPWWLRYASAAAHLARPLPFPSSAPGSQSFCE